MHVCSWYQEPVVSGTFQFPSTFLRSVLEKKGFNDENDELKAVRKQDDWWLRSMNNSRDDEISQNKISKAVLKIIEMI